MPVILEKLDDVYLFSGNIKYMFKNCPKPSGWFGCYFNAKDRDENIKLKGMYPKDHLADLNDKTAEFMVLATEMTEDDGQIAYVVKSMQLMPSSRSVKRILNSVEGVGRATISKIIDNFGAKAYDIIVHKPEKLKALGIKDEKVEAIVNAFSDAVVTRVFDILKIIPDLTYDQGLNILDYYQGLRSAGRLSQNLEPWLKTLLKTDPYRLAFVPDLKISFGTADKIAMKHGFTFDSKRRLYAAFCYALNGELNASTFIDLTDDFSSYVNSVLLLLNSGNTNYITEQYIEDNFLKVMKKISKDCDDFFQDYFKLEGDHLYPLRRWETERSVARRIAEKVSDSSVANISPSVVDEAIYQFELKEKFVLDEYQKEAVKMAVTNQLSVIDGGPGRGKSFVAKCIVYVWNKCTRCKPLLMAPTGKASNRLREATGVIDVNTVAKWLYTNFDKMERSEKSRFFDNLIIVDEASMLGLSDIKGLFAIAERCNLVFMGDSNQLPSIAYGQFFRDICSSVYVPRVTLKINHRTCSIIADNADRCLNKVHVEDMDLTTGDDKTFQVWNFDGVSAKASDYIISTYLDTVLIGVNGDFNILWQNMMNTCLLCPVHGKDSGVQSLNARIQEYLNPGGELVEKFKYCKGPNNPVIIPRVGDRVIVTKNDKRAEYLYVFGRNAGEVGTGIYNGDCGIIKSWNPGDISNNFMAEIDLLLDDGREYRLKAEDCHIELGYALTIHKSQGSEYDNVIISFPVDVLYAPKGFASQNLLYTAMTRAKKSCIIYGSGNALNACIDSPTVSRHSDLVNKIDEYMQIIAQAV